MRIFVILPEGEDQYLTLEQEPSDLIRTMKENIQNILDSKQARSETEKSKHKIENQVLIINDEYLEDNKKIEDYVIKSETFIELSFISKDERVNIAR